jgi:hypothetical protein
VHIQRDFGAAVGERPAEGAGIDLAAADERLQVDVMDVNQRLGPLIFDTGPD